VPPGKKDLARVIPMTGGAWNRSIVATVDVKPGGITKLTIGGTGRKVAGLSVIHDSPTAFDWSKVDFFLRPELPPGSDRQVSRESEYYFADLTTNGSFVFEDVAPGSYELSATAVQRGIGQPFDVHVLAQGSKKVTIPEVGAGHDGELYDIGTLELQSVHPLNIGDPATSVEAETPDGRKMHLADFRGKYVLMTILTDNFGGRPALPQLKETFDEFGKDPRLGMFSVMYLPAHDLTEYARTNGIGWTVATLAGQSSQLQDYFESVKNLRESQTFLIDPQGRILGKGLQGAAIKEAVANALARK
jgi:peroxiredoxin